MKNLRRSFERLCYRNQRRGIPNLMLWIAIGNLIVYFISMIDPSGLLYTVLRFDRSAILHGQVWRLFSYIFTYLLDAGGITILLGLVSLLCYYFMGRMLEQQWGVFRFNLYYLSGIVLMDIAALLIGCNATTTYLNTSLFLAVATVMPEVRFLVFYLIPMKAKYLAWVTILLSLWGIYRSLMYELAIYHRLTLVSLLTCLFPVIALANYFLFFGKDVAKLLPDSLLHRKSRTQRQYQTRQQSRAGGGSSAKPYRHKCTVCGRTDADFPLLEFRYCSRCKGFYCYCSDHINNHTHIT